MIILVGRKGGDDGRAWEDSVNGISSGGGSCGGCGGCGGIGKGSWWQS